MWEGGGNSYPLSKHVYIRLELNAAECYRNVYDCQSINTDVDEHCEQACPVSAFSGITTDAVHCLVRKCPSKSHVTVTDDVEVGNQNDRTAPKAPACHIIPQLIELHWLPVCWRVQYKPI